MGRRLVLKVESGVMAYSDLRSFVNAANEMKLKGSASINVYVTHDKLVEPMCDKEPHSVVRFSTVLPGGSDKKLKRRIVIIRKTPQQKAVEKQIADHKEKKAKGEVEAYVPPVGHTGPPKPVKVKCPVCNTRKLITGRPKVIKPHISKGEPCPGSATQVVKKGKKWIVPEAEPATVEGK